MQSWKKARLLCKAVFDLANMSAFADDYSLKDQIKRSSGSVMDNIAEGFDRGTSKEFRRFLFIAKGSLSEVKSQLYRALDQIYINQEDFEHAFSLATETGKLLGGLIKYLETKIDSNSLNEEELEYGLKQTDIPLTIN